LKPAPTSGRDTNRTTASISVRLVVADVTTAARKLPFGRVSERVADRQAEQHAFETVERHEAERRRRAEHGERAGSEAEPALCDQLVEHGLIVAAESWGVRMKFKEAVEATGLDSGRLCAGLHAFSHDGSNGLNTSAPSPATSERLRVASVIR
jgi:hypothetical protein